MMVNDLYIVFSNIKLVITLTHLSAYTFSMRYSGLIFVKRNFRFELLLLLLALPKSVQNTGLSLRVGRLFG